LQLTVASVDEITHPNHTGLSSVDLGKQTYSRTFLQDLGRLRLVVLNKSSLFF
jgi:hypothetical protein